MEDMIPSVSGIYKITCTANKKIYIGSAVDLRHRKRDHWYLLRKNKHHNLHLQNAWNKYGEQAFIFEVLELVLLLSTTAREQYWLNKLKPFGKRGFNIALDATSPTLGRKRLTTPEHREKLRQAKLGKKLSAEHRAKMSQARTGKNLGHGVSSETREKLRHVQLGRKHTPEWIEKTRHVHLGRKASPETREKQRQAKLGRRHSSEARENMRLAQLGKRHTPEAIEKNRQAHLGKKQSPETLERRRQTMLAKKEKLG